MQQAMESMMDRGFFGVGIADCLPERASIRSLGLGIRNGGIYCVALGPAEGAIISCCHFLV